MDSPPRAPITKLAGLVLVGALGVGGASSLHALPVC
jgi:hypothetical protein